MLINARSLGDAALKPSNNSTMLWMHSPIWWDFWTFIHLDRGSFPQDPSSPALNPKETAKIKTTKQHSHPESERLRDYFGCFPPSVAAKEVEMEWFGHTEKWKSERCRREIQSDRRGQESKVSEQKEKKKLDGVMITAITVEQRERDKK